MTQTDGTASAGAVAGGGPPLGTFEVVAGILAAWGIGIAAPLLEVIGRNPPFLVAHDLLGLQVVVFGVVVALFVPAVLFAAVLGLRRLSVPVAGAVFRVVVALLVAAMLLGVVRRVAAPAWVVVAGCLVVGAAAGLVLRRPVVCRFMRVLAVAPVLVLGLFLVGSPASDLLTGDVEVAAVTVGDPAPVVLVVLDEFPLSSLLDEQGEVDHELYPQFARLASSSTWFRNATTVSTSTAQAVPALLTGRRPDEDALPIASQHADSLFELLSSYDITAVEPITQLCQFDWCNAAGAVAPGAADVPVSVTVTDTWFVLLHQLTPPSLADGLPRIDDNWVGFADDAAVAASEDDPDEASEAASPFTSEDQRAITKEALGEDSAAPMRAVAERIASGGLDDDTFVFGHFLLPHSPWRRLPDGSRYEATVRGEPGVARRGEWGGEQWLLEHAYRRHLLQVQFTDTVLGELLDAIEATGAWEESLVVVVADHGITFQPDVRRRTVDTPRTAADTAHVPLFVKLPGQTEGMVSDAEATILDVAPTIADVVDVRPRPDVGGMSLLGPDGQPLDDLSAAEGVRSGARVPFEQVVDAASVKYRLYDPLGDGPGYYAFGPARDVLGEPATPAAGQSSSPWQVRFEGRAELEDVDRDGGLLPVLVAGTASGGDPTEPPLLAIAVNGVVAGIAQTWVDDGEVRFQTLVLPDTLRDGANEVAAFELVAADDRGFALVPTSAA